MQQLYGLLKSTLSSASITFPESRKVMSCWNRHQRRLQFSLRVTQETAAIGL